VQDQDLGDAGISEEFMTEIADTEHIDASDTYTPLRRAFRKFVHWASYTFILSSKRTRKVRVGDLRLTVPPSVFHPGIFITSRIFANYLRCVEFRDKVVVEVGTGTGVLALSAARAGAQKVLALDINPSAAAAAAQNASANGLAGVVEARTSNLFSAVAREEMFDVIICSPPSFGGEPRDMADRAWHAGHGYRDIHPLFRQAHEHLAEDGEMFLLLSSDTNVRLIERLARQAGFDWALLARRSIFVESFLIFRLTKGATVGTARCWLPRRAEVQAAYFRHEARQEVILLEALAIAKVALENVADKDALSHTIRGIDQHIDARTSPGDRAAYIAQAVHRLSGRQAPQTAKQASA
jgi:release factor glutamine methyltransferase